MRVKGGSLFFYPLVRGITKTGARIFLVENECLVARIKKVKKKPTLIQSVDLLLFFVFRLKHDLYEQ